MRRLLIPALMTGLLAAACGDDTTGGGGSGGNAASGGNATTGGSGQGGVAQGGGAQGGEGGGTTMVCGDGLVDEACDDGNTTDGDGCSASCEVEAGFSCDGTPSVCVTTCGDGVVGGDEACDDSNTQNADGCSAMCAVESGYDCGNASPSVCTATCGDGLVAAGSEDCDDQNVLDGDGCSASCTVENGWSCMNEPSVCMTGCGDGIIAGTEGCDDNNALAGDGCSAACAVESGYSCNGMPSVCEIAGSCASPIVVTGNGFVWQAPTLDPYGDDLQNEDLNSCAAHSPSMSAVRPDVVFTVDLDAGDTLHVAESGTADVLMHVLDGACASASLCLESVDEIGADEINPGLQFQAPAAGTYFVVIDTWGTSSPTASIDLLFEIGTCGDGAVSLAEGCDDGNAMAGDGCAPGCTVEPGFVCSGSPSMCTPAPAGTNCSSPIMASDGFVFTGSNIDQYGDDYNFSDASCQDVSGTNASPEILFQIPLNAGDSLNVANLGLLDTVMQVRKGACGAGACFAKHDDPESPGLTFKADTTDTYYVAVESWSPTPSAASTYDLHFSVATCGDNVVELGEPCDDGDNTGGDGCSATCTVEPGFTCSGSPSVCTNVPLASCADPIVVGTTPFVFSGTNIAQFADTENYNAGTGCVDASTTPPSGYDVVFRVDVNAGDTVKVRELGTLDAVFHILTEGACGAGTACVASTDGNETTGITYQAPTTGSVYVVVESWGNPGAAVTYDVRIDVVSCGDGVVSAPEACDDGNGTAGDGCTSCTIDSGYTCSGSPSICALPEIDCNDGIDNNGTNGVDAADPSCALPAYFPACGAGQHLLVYPGTGGPFADNTPAAGVISNITVASVLGTIQKVAILFDVSHTWDSDVDVYLTPPGVTERDVCTDNGASGDNFVNTVLDSTCANPVTGGTAPFSGCFAPETSLGGLNGTSPNGQWSLRVADDEAGIVGTLNSWALVLCTQ